MKWLLLLLLCNCNWFTLSLSAESDSDCSRQASKHARYVIEKLLLPVFEKNEEEIPKVCLLDTNRDIYGENHKHKIEENVNRWVCDYCGKAFYEERFLDAHFNNRHPTTINKASDALCLGANCDFLRCDYLHQLLTIPFWDKALCKDGTVRAKRKRCQQILKTCVPTSLKGWRANRFQLELEEAVCSFLTCEKFWDPIEEKEDRFTVATYIVASVFYCFFVIIYYFLVFSGDLSPEDQLRISRQVEERHRHRCKDTENLRHRRKATLPYRDKQ